MKELIRSDWNYILYEKDEKLILSAVCGTVAIFEVNIVLNEEERSAFEKNGKDYIDSLASDVRNNPSGFMERYIAIYQ